jgi:hypothetical protein
VQVSPINSNAYLCMYADMLCEKKGLLYMFTSCELLVFTDFLFVSVCVFRILGEVPRMNEADFKEKVQLFIHYSRCLELGQNVVEANSWIYGFLSNPYSAFVALWVLENGNMGYAEYIALNVLSSLLRNVEWVIANSNVLSRIQSVRTSTRFRFETVSNRLLTGIDLNLFTSSRRRIAAYSTKFAVAVYSGIPSLTDCVGR